jgi:hypothetical protein
MKTYRIVALMLMTLPLGAQTAAELLQKGIYDQETAGDLDGAIAVYRQIVNSGSSPRDVAAQAQYRLAQSLLQKGDLPNGAQEFSNLARNYADYGKLVSSLATQARGLTRTSESEGLTAQQRAMADRAKAELLALEVQRIGAANMDDRQAKIAAALAEVEARAVKQQALAGGRGGRGGVFSRSRTFDGPATTVTGIVASIAFVTPAGTITVDSSDGTGNRYRFITAGPAELTAQGFTHDSLRPGDQVTITGVPANGGEIDDGLITARATTITGPDGRKLFDRATLRQSSNPCRWVSDTVPPPCAASK